MGCAFCGEGDGWIKTCRTPDGLIRVCDPCWEILASWLIVVPGDGVVTARCEGCGSYHNPREMAEYSPGGRYNAYSGKCRACAMISAVVPSEVPNPVTSNLEFTPGAPGYGLSLLGVPGVKEAFAGPYTLPLKGLRLQGRVASAGLDSISSRKGRTHPLVRRAARGVSS